jgi:hypothetical protein
MRRLTKAQREILTLMAAGNHRQTECAIVEDPDHFGWILVEDIEPTRYVAWQTVKILEREGLIFDACSSLERYVWQITEAGRLAATSQPADAVQREEAGG